MAKIQVYHRLYNYLQRVHCLQLGVLAKLADLKHEELIPLVNGKKLRKPERIAAERAMYGYLLAMGDASEEVRAILE